MIDISNARETFKKYISNYNIKDPKIELKVIHMYHVANNSAKISKMMGLSEKEQKLAELIGLLHDIGRFEQIKQYNTFADSKSIDHGQKGVEVLFKNGLIKEFVQEKEEYDIIYKAIYNHNKYEIEKGLSEREMLHCKIIRDADNLDIYRGLMEQKIEDFGYFNSKNISEEIISLKIFEEFKKEKLIVYSDVETDMDVMVAIIAHIYAINFKETLNIIKENNYINGFVERLDCKDEYTKVIMNEVADIAMNYIEKRINKGE